MKIFLSESPLFVGLQAEWNTDCREVPSFMKVTRENFQD